MTIEALGIINNLLDNLIPYEFRQWTGTLSFPYWIGEYSEVAPMSEDGEEETTFIITGTTTGNFIELENGKQIIAEEFPKISGKTVKLSDSSIMKIWYETAYPVPTDDNNIKRLQVNLRIKEWKVNE